MAWVEGPNVPIAMEGLQCWKWVDGNRTSWRDKPVLDVVPTDFSRDPQHCGGVWFYPIDPPSNPHQLGLNKKESS